MRRGPPPFGGPTETAYLMRSGPEDAYMCEDCLADFETIRDDFASLDDWEDRYRYVIELGHTLEPLGEAAHNESNKCGAASVRYGWNARRERASTAKRSCTIAATATRTSFPG